MLDTICHARAVQLVLKFHSCLPADDTADVSARFHTKETCWTARRHPKKSTVLRQAITDKLFRADKMQAASWVEVTLRHVPRLGPIFVTAQQSI
jgi:hypothetical protein